MLRRAPPASCRVRSASPAWPRNRRDTSRPGRHRQCSCRYRRGCGWLPRTPCGSASAPSRRDRSRNWRSWDRRSPACRVSWRHRWCCGSRARSARPWRSPTAARYRRARSAAGWRRSASARRRLSAGCASSQSARSMWVEKCSETKRTLRVVGREESATSTASMRLSFASSAFSFAPASSSPTRPTKMQRAPSEAILRATLPAPPILVSLRRTAITGAGASGEIRDTSP